MESAEIFHHRDTETQRYTEKTMITALNPGIASYPANLDGPCGGGGPSPLPIYLFPPFPRFLPPY